MQRARYKLLIHKRKPAGYPESVTHTTRKNWSDFEKTLLEKEIWLVVGKEIPGEGGNMNDSRYSLSLFIWQLVFNYIKITVLKQPGTNTFLSIVHIYNAEFSQIGTQEMNNQDNNSFRF